MAFLSIETKQGRKVKAVRDYTTILIYTIISHLVSGVTAREVREISQSKVITENNSILLRKILLGTRC